MTLTSGYVAWRTSKSACLSCHKSYPESHVQAYGALFDMYVAGGDESFTQ